MSLLRLIYYSTLLAGWAAFFGWLASEMFREDVKPEAQTLLVMLTAGITGAAVGLGLNVVAGMSNGQWRQLLRRAGPGALGGGIGGIVGGLVGDFLYQQFGYPRAIGWLIMGLGIGVVEGVYEKSPRKIRNGLLGGGIGGLVGGVLFDPIVDWTHTQSGMASRATAFVVLGLCIGAAISLAQVVLKEAWLTVVDGYRTGRQLTLTQPVTMLGRSDNLPLPFLGPTNKDLEPEHVSIARRRDGTYVLEDNHSRLGTRVNSQPVQGPMPLADGDVIRLGTNLVRFNQRRRRAGQVVPVVPARWTQPAPGAPPRPAPLPAPASSVPPPPPRPVPGGYPAGPLPPGVKPWALRPPPPPPPPPGP
ncbi:MAG: FHA domain-containing protein [Thermoguttaceae bacterium]|jgi:uncharacterized membrane protein YeaQ/YmgE (transglycosylase-associated protein family)